MDNGWMYKIVCVYIIFFIKNDFLNFNVTFQDDASTAKRLISLGYGPVSCVSIWEIVVFLNVFMSIFIL